MKMGKFYTRGFWSAAELEADLSLTILNYLVLSGYLPISSYLPTYLYFLSPKTQERVLVLFVSGLPHDVMSSTEVRMTCSVQSAGRRMA